MQEVKRPATATTSKISEPVKANVIKERPLSSGASDRKATQPAQPVHGYSCLTNQKQYYAENYPQMAIEKGNIDEVITMMIRGVE